MEKENNLSEKIDAIFAYLNKEFPNPKCELKYNNPFELLCAVVLSAQCTDKRVNQVTPNLFAKYPTPKTLANASIQDVQNIIKSCGFYNNKSKALIGLSKDLCEKYNGIVPDNFEDLVSLQGVGRKTANVVLGEAFDKNELGVDTHIFRVSHRLELSNGSTPEKVEQDLRKVFVGKKLNKDHYLLVLFGRYICKAISPQCEKCELKQYCDYYIKNIIKNKKNRKNR